MICNERKVDQRLLKFLNAIRYVRIKLDKIIK